MKPEVSDELAKLAALSQGLSAAWPTLSVWLAERQERFTRKLIEKDDPELRGRIKELVALHELPTALQQQAIVLQLPEQEEHSLDN